MGSRTSGWLLALIVLAPSSGQLLGQNIETTGLEKLTEVEAIKPAQDDSRLVQKLIERVNVAADAYRYAYSKYKRGVTGVDPVFAAAVRLYDSRIELLEERQEGLEEKMRILEALHAILVEEESVFQRRVDDPVLKGAGRDDLARVKYARLSVEIEIERVKKAQEN